MENPGSSAVRRDLARNVAFCGRILAGGHHSVRPLILIPPVCRRYLLSYCLIRIATNAADKDINRLAYRRFEVVTISAVRLFSTLAERRGLRLGQWIG